MSEDVKSKKIVGFGELGLAPTVLKAVESVGYETPTPIQAMAIPPLLAGNDIIGQAQTGTGKTAAFALPLLSRLDMRASAPQILVLTPTRELALQVAEAMSTYARGLRGFHVLPIYGGQSIGIQLRQLRRTVHVVVGTPGRIQDHLRRKTLDLSKLSAVVLDEADEMLRMGFVDEVEEILVHTPENKQVALFSATMPAAIRKIAARHLRQPVEIEIKSKTATVETVEQHYWRVGNVHKLDALTRILEAEEFDAMLIFVRTKIATAELSEKLEARGFASAPLNGDMNQSLRERTIERFKKGTLDIVVATDVAARGLDVDRISHVINFDIPYDVEAYVHRIGRTGRAGRTGTAILFVSPRERSMLHAIERATRQRIAPMELPTAQDVSARRVALFKSQLQEILETQELDFFAEMLDDFRNETDTSSRALGAALAFMAQKKRPLRPRPEKKRPRKEPKSPPRYPPPPSDSAERKRPQRASKPEAGKQRYRVEIGRDRGLKPGNLVGALTNEGGLDGSDIGQIQIYDTFSTVDLPEGLSRAFIKGLKKVWVCGRKLRISHELADRERRPSGRPPGRSPTDGRKPTRRPPPRR